MHTHRFGRKLKLPSTRAIKHEILTLMLQDALKAQAVAAKSDKELVAVELGGVRRLNAIELNEHGHLLRRPSVDFGDRASPAMLRKWSAQIHTR